MRADARRRHVRPRREDRRATTGCQPLAAPATVTIKGPPYTASFDSAPGEHDESAVTVRFRMSVEPQGLSYVTVRDSLFDVTGGTIRQTRRMAQGSNKDWELTVEPSGFGAVTLALIATTDCDGTPGVCDAAGRKLEGPLSLTLGLVFMPWRKVHSGLQLLFDKESQFGEGEVKPFDALMTGSVPRAVGAAGCIEEAQAAAWRKWTGRGPTTELEMLTRAACSTRDTGESVTQGAPTS